MYTSPRGKQSPKNENRKAGKARKTILCASNCRKETVEELIFDVKLSIRQNVVNIG